VSSVGEIEIRTAHEVVAARTTQLALLVDQLMPALRTKPPMLAGNVFVGRCGATVFCGFLRSRVLNAPIIVGDHFSILVDFLFAMRLLDEWESKQALHAEVKRGPKWQ